MIFNVQDAEWDMYLARMPLDKRDIYYTAQYNKMQSYGQDGIPQMYVLEDAAGNLGLYVYQKTAVLFSDDDSVYYDIQTPYGYGGPLLNTDNAEFISTFEESFLAYCRQENIIAEFVRFHPLLENEHIFRNQIQVLHNRKTVWIDLTQDLDGIWMHQVSSQNRNTIRKCGKNQLRTEVSQDYQTFREIYGETMQKVEAENFYFFEEEYFEEMKKDAHYTLLCVKEQDRIIAAAVFMGYGAYFHYHLSGSRRDALALSPNNLLLWEAIKYAKEHGYKKMHLGGGLTDSTEDNLFRFKSRYSKHYADFYIGKRVHNPVIYNGLIAQWEEKNKRKAAILLQYRE